MNKSLHFAYWLVVLVAVLSALIAGYSGFSIWTYTKVNNYIESDNRIEQKPPEHYKSIFAHAFDHTVSERSQDALDELTRLIAREDIKADGYVNASSYFNRGNIHLRQAASMVKGDLKRIPLVELAKQDYRTALLLYSKSWDARFNLEVALRMVPEKPEQDGSFEQPKISSQKSIESVGFRVDLP